MDQKIAAKKVLFLSILPLFVLQGCQSTQPPKVVEALPEPVKEKPVEPPVQEPPRAEWKIEAEKKALAAREAERQRKLQAAADRKRVAAARKEAEKKKRAREREEKKRKAAVLDLAVERALKQGKLQLAEEKMDAYQALKGEAALREPKFQRYRQQLVEMKQAFADLEQARAAERYLQQLLDEASRLERKGKREAARAKYGEVLVLDPTHPKALRGLEQLTVARVEPPLQPQPKPEAKKPKKPTSSLLGKKAAGWVVQVATFPASGKKEAFSLLGTIKKAGFKAVFIKKQELAGRQLYRVRIGAYGDRAEAERIQQRINRKLAELDIQISGRLMQQKP